MAAKTTAKTVIVSNIKAHIGNPEVVTLISNVPVGWLVLKLSARNTHF
jgi:hypothetical protein